MHLINLSLDLSLFNTKKIGDSHERFIAYAKGYESFTVLVPIKQTNQSYQKDGITYIPGNGNNQLTAYIKTFTYLNELVTQQKSSLIICNDPVLGFIALIVKIKFSQVKIQINSFGTRLNQWKWLFEKPYNPLLWILGYVSIVFADSIRTDTSEDKKIIQKFTNKSDSKILVLPVPPSKKNQDTLLSIKHRNFFSVPIKLVAVGSLTTNKDFPTLIKALSKVDNKIDFHLTLIGSGPEEEAIKKLIHFLQLTNKISIKTNLDYNKLFDYYQSSDILISSSKIEGLPRVIQEAVLAGLPIISTAHNGAKDFITNRKTGLVVPIGDSVALAHAIESLWNNPKLALTFSQNGRSFAKDYCNFDRVVEKLQNSWAKMVSNI
jgi:glycosyltransferase involved in cell wall biosynthesis